MAILLASVLLQSCGTNQTIEPIIPCGPRPELLEIDPEFEVSPHVQSIVTENYLRLIQYAKKLEARAACSR